MNRKRAKQTKNRKLIRGIVILILGAISLYAGVSLSDDTTPDGYVNVERVVDGDTFVTAEGEKVRLIGVDTPESVAPGEDRNVPFGKVASEYTEKLIEGKNVRLEYDAEQTDRYGRMLAYIYLEDGTFVNDKLVREGYARCMTVPPNIKYESRFLESQQQAKEEGLGVWEDYDNIFK
jgi:micrococcal nuclease